MQRRPFERFGDFGLLMTFLAVGAILGVAFGFMIWNPGATNYSIISASEEAVRTVKIGDISLTYPSVLICKVGEESSISIEISNLDNDIEYNIFLSLNVVRSNGVDSKTISDIIGNPYRVTLAAYGSATSVLNFEPSDNGYAIFDLNVRGELAGTITLYIVSSP